MPASWPRSFSDRSGTPDTDDDTYGYYLYLVAMSKGEDSEKAKRKYSRKYSGTELRARIYKSCVQQGYSSSDVVRVLDGMEWFEDEEN